MKQYADLSEKEIKNLRKKGILNGFGGASQSWIVRKLIGCILVDFDNAIPDFHDYGYYIGGDEERRKYCDEKFWQAMVLDIQKKYLQGMITKSGFVYKTIIANLSYRAIRIFGSKYFNYGKFLSRHI